MYYFISLHILRVIKDFDKRRRVEIMFKHFFIGAEAAINYAFFLYAFMVIFSYNFLVSSFFLMLGIPFFGHVIPSSPPPSLPFSFFFPILINLFSFHKGDEKNVKIVFCE